MADLLSHYQVYTHFDEEHTIMECDRCPFVISDEHQWDDLGTVIVAAAAHEATHHSPSRNA